MAEVVSQNRPLFFRRIPSSPGKRDGAAKILLSLIVRPFSLSQSFEKTGYPVKTTPTCSCRGLCTQVMGALSQEAIV